MRISNIVSDKHIRRGKSTITNNVYSPSTIIFYAQKFITKHFFKNKLLNLYRYWDVGKYKLSNAIKNIVILSLLATNPPPQQLQPLPYNLWKKQEIRKYVPKYWMKQLTRQVKT